MQKGDLQFIFLAKQTAHTVISIMLSAVPAAVQIAAPTVGTTQPPVIALSTVYGPSGTLPIVICQEVVRNVVLGDSAAAAAAAHLLVHRNELLAIQPHIVVCTRLRGQQVCNVLSILLSVQVVLAVLVRSRGSHHVAVHITACAKGGAHVLDHRGKHCLQVSL
jgi:hypothetical protein